MNKNKNKQCKTHHPSDPNEKFGENPSLKSAWNGVLNFPLYLTTATYKKAYVVWVKKIHNSNFHVKISVFKFFLSLNLDIT